MLRRTLLVALLAAGCGDEMSGCLVVLLTGQSVQRSGSDGDASNLPVGSYWQLDDSPVAFAPFAPQCGVKDLQIARELRAAGRDCIIINLAIAGTSSTQWLPPSGSAYVTAKASLDAALALLAAELAGRTPHWIHFHDQGEFEVNLANPGGSAQVNAWASNALALFAQLETDVGSEMQHVVGLTKIPQPVNNWGPEVRAQQETAAGDAAHTINRDALDYNVDEIHLSIASGQPAYGALQGQKTLELSYSMTISHGTATRTAIADTVVDRVDAGAAAGKLVIRASSSVLATITLADPAFGAAAAGVAALLGVPLDDNASASGTADNFLATDSDGNTVFAGSVTATGGGGDLTLDTVTIVNGNPVTITGGSYTAPP